MASGYPFSDYPGHPPWIFLTYMSGVLISSIRVILGRLGLVFLKKKALPLCSENYNSIARTLSTPMGVKRNIFLLKSPLCRIPFTYSILKPTVILPLNVENWSPTRIRHVLFHELAHVRRRNYLILLIARILCALFWFMPMMWIAYSKLQSEQERACDAIVVERGVKPTTYARQLVEIARFTRGHGFLSCVFIYQGGKKMLEERI
jgi:beta-lactamase regulating signal transducer with metallopeptidase domain